MSHGGGKGGEIGIPGPSPSTGPTKGQPTSRGWGGKGGGGWIILTGHEGTAILAIPLDGSGS